MDLEALKVEIDASGLKKEKIAEELHMTPNTLTRKLKGDSEFNASEIGGLVSLLKFTPEKTARIFYPFVLN